MIKNSKIVLSREIQLYIICSAIAEKYSKETFFSNMFGMLCIGPCFMNYLHEELQRHIKNDALIHELLKLVFETTNSLVELNEDST